MSQLCLSCQPKGLARPLRRLGCLTSLLVSAAAVAGGSCPADITGDGQVDGADLSVLLGGWGQAGASDISGDGNTDGTDLGLLLGSWGLCPEAPVEVSVAAGAAAISFNEGGSAGVAFTIEVAGIGDAAVVLAVSQLSMPAGLSIVNDVPEGGFLALSDGTFVFNALVSGGAAGDYAIETQVVPSEGDSASVSLPVAVLPLAGIPDLSPLSVDPAAVNPEVPTTVVFSVSLSGTSAAPAEFTLARTQPDGTPIAFPTTLRDDGVAPDLAAGDGVYTGQVTVTAGPAEDARFYKAFESVAAAGGVLETPLYELNVTPFPVGPAPSDPASVVEGPGGTSVYSNEVIVVFAPGTSDARISEIVDSIDGTIVGSVPATGAYQVSFPGDGTFAGVQAVISQMKTVVDVDIVEPLFPTTTAELVPNDPLWATQTGLAAVRATEAWTVANGEVVIAIVDTGVDAAHPDFQRAGGGSKVIVLPGSDVLDGDDDPGDPDGHGTRMAGIAAAIGNNGLGIAGVAWRSPVLAVRAFGAGASDLTLAQGIVFAAANGAKVINVSGGLEAPTIVVEDAIAYARERGCLIVASAGSQVDGANVTTYPCSFAGVLCVGAVDDAGAPLPGANVSLSIDLLAPGAAVPTTLAGGGYGTASGTSPAAAMVAGAAAVVWSVDPTASPSVIEERLLAGAAPLPPSVLDPADGRLDLFESAFDGSFELPTLATWSTEGTVSVLESLGPLLPTDRARMAYVSTGPAGAGVAASLRKDFVVQPGVTMFSITFDYDFVTEEWPEYVGSQFNDSLRIVLVEPDGAEILLAIETVNDSVFFPIEGIDFPGGDDTVGHTGWKTVSVVVPITKGPGSYTVRIEDAGDDVFDSVALVDRIRLVGDPQALYCGAPNAGDCCEANRSPFCADGGCCNVVCLIDPSCCQAEWDQACALIASQSCDGCTPAGELCDNGIDDDGDGLVDCDDPDCAAFPGCTKSGLCGDPQSNSCCIVHLNPYCDDAECCEAVCAEDPFCCNSSWDSICVNRAFAICSVCAPAGEVCDNGIDDDGDGLVDCEDPDCGQFPGCGGGSGEICDNGIDDDGDGLVDCDDPDCAAFPGCTKAGGCGDAQSGDCCKANGTPFCSDAACCETVCAADAFCCATAWDSICADVAAQLCGGLCGGGGGQEICDNGLDDDGDGLIDCGDPDCANDPGCGGDCPGGCDDGDPCTVDTCVDGVCVHTPIDADGDGYPPISCGGGDCDDGNPNVNPGAKELCSDGIDNDCDGLVDCDDPDCASDPGCGAGGGSFADLCADAPLVQGGFLAVDTLGATGSGSVSGIPIQKDVWAKYVATCTGLITVSNCPAYGEAVPPDWDSVIALWVGTSCGSLQLVAVSDNLCDLRSGVVAPVTAGSTYYIQVGGKGSVNAGIGTVYVACGDCGGCAEGALSENEPCGVRLNDACNMQGAPATQPIEAGQSFCGEVWASGNSRDTDFYSFTLEAPAVVEWRVFADLPLSTAIFPAVCPFGTPLAAGDFLVCPDTLTVSLPAGTHWAFVATYGFEGLPCNAPIERRYTATLSVTPIVESCDNGVDDDGDGLVDCDDPDCAQFPGCGGGADEVCDNGIDDDGDGLIDCDDPDCADFEGCQPFDWATVLEFSPDPDVITDPEWRARILATGLPWRVQDDASGIEMLLVPPGTYMMGCSPSEQYGCNGSENPVHEVTLTRAFYLGRYEVTQAQWTAVMGSNPSSFQSPSTQVPADQVPNRPVERVSWNMIQGFEAETGLRLPTEAEWEYACRAGTQTAFNLAPDGTNDDGLLGQLAWFNSNAASQTRPVGQKQANNLGLHDMHGNVWEWVEDWYGIDYYAQSPAVDPPGPSSAVQRVLRGGSLIGDSGSCRASRRGAIIASTAWNDLGLRVARSAYPDCDDGDPCTTDEYVDGTCVHTPIVCDDGDPCTVDTCVDGVCVHTPLVCDDGDSCTIDTCVDGLCVHTPIDADGDGYAPIACGGGDCDDGNPNVNPSAKELCSDGIDNDCDGLVDCDDPDCAQFPGCGGGEEVCDNDLDDDGDGLVDCDDPDCVDFGGCSPQDWATVLEFEPDPAVVTDPETVAAIIATGLPWRVRDNVTQIEMLLVPAGTFVMGCSPSLQSGCSADENPPHQVVLTRPFYLGRYEVTQSEWVAVMGTNPSTFQGQADSPQRPVENISWDRVTQFKAASGLRLPTEAEWEYACRAGTGTAYHHSTSDAALLSEVAWFASNNSPAGTKAVGQKAANAWGFHDMHGNVYEWCEDWYSETYYASSPTVDPTGPASGTSKVMRSGFFNGPASACRSSARSNLLAGGLASFYNGFRVLRYPAVGTETCDNGVDDDGDGLVDCDDPNCADVPGCCPDGQVVCGDACVDLATDVSNCGDCGVVCDDGDPCTVDTCVDGVCVHTLIDADGDGYPPLSCGGGDCDDGNPNVNPGVKELCSDGIDNDCDGLVDCDDPDCALCWATVLEIEPDPSVITIPEWRERIVATGLPWRVRDNASGIEMLLVPPGTFMMGCSPSDAYGCYSDEYPVHEVTLTEAVYLGRYEVTQAQWTAVMGSNPSAFQSASAQVPAAQVPNRPVERVSWHMIQDFEAATGLRLPTEAQWEYACRAGTQTAFNLAPDGTDADSQLGLLAWYDANSANQTRPVGQKQANNLGLYDMHGNVFEWVEDWYGYNYYSVSPPVDPPGPMSGAYRVMRGGGWSNVSDVCRAASRLGFVPGNRFVNVGFRVARTP